MNAIKVKPRKVAKGRWFGRCMTDGCKFRRVTESVADINPGADGNNALAYCDICHHQLRWDQLYASYSAERECNGVCMGAVGPSCDCSCGGENHGKGHVA